jgi:hypothetical protein
VLRARIGDDVAEESTDVGIEAEEHRGQDESAWR